jgi:hypothetical protein
MQKVTLNQETVFQYDGVLLYPGLNTVTDEQLEKLKTATLSVEFGVLELPEGKPAKKPPAADEADAKAAKEATKAAEAVAKPE